MIILFIKTRIVIADLSGMNRVHIKEKAEHTCPKISRFGLKQVFEQKLQIIISPKESRVYENENKQQYHKIFSFLFLKFE